MFMVRTDININILSSLFSRPPDFSSSLEFVGVVVVVVDLVVEVFFFVGLKVKTSGPWYPSYDIYIQL